MSNNSANKFDMLPWIEKYRPTNLDEIISQDKIIKNLKICIAKKCLPYIFLAHAKIVEVFPQPGGP